MRFCLFIVAILFAAHALATPDRFLIHFDPPDFPGLVGKEGECTSASNLRAIYTRYVIRLLPKPTSEAEWFQKFFVECKKVRADERSSGTVEILDAEFDGSVFVVGVDDANEDLSILEVKINGKRPPIFRDSHIFHNIYIRKNSDTFASCFAMTPISEEVNFFNVMLVETDKFVNNWECRVMAGHYVEKKKAGLRAGVPSIVRLVSNVAPDDVRSVEVDSVEVDEEATNFILPSETEEEPTANNDSEEPTANNDSEEPTANEKTGDDGEGVTVDGIAEEDGEGVTVDNNTDTKEETPDDDAFKFKPPSCSMCRESLRRLGIPIGSAIIPHLTPKMVNGALDDQDRQMQQYEDDPSRVVPGCVKCRQLLNKLGIPSDSPIVPYLNIDILVAAMNDMDGNVSSDEQPEDSDMPCNPETPQEDSKNMLETPGPSTVYAIWTKITPIFRTVPIFFHKSLNVATT